MSQERAFVENLLGQRFNFFLVFFSIVLAGYVNAKGRGQQTLILGIGLLICGMLRQTLSRAQNKLEVIMGILENTEHHPIKEVNDKVDKVARKGSRRRLIGYHIPALCCLILAAGLFVTILFPRLIP
jgi:hypothetical protein